MIEPNVYAAMQRLDRPASLWEIGAEIGRTMPGGYEPPPWDLMPWMRQLERRGLVRRTGRRSHHVYELAPTGVDLVEAQA